MQVHDSVVVQLLTDPRGGGPLRLHDGRREGGRRVEGRPHLQGEEDVLPSRHVLRLGRHTFCLQVSRDWGGEGTF